jgi:6-phosphogluconolactonase (cycloisomerase 2 family)
LACTVLETPSWVTTSGDPAGRRIHGVRAAQTQAAQEGWTVAFSRPDSRFQIIEGGVTRRKLLVVSGAAGLTAAAAAMGRTPGRARAQDATPVAATPVAGAARFAYVGTYTRGAPGGGGSLTPEGISVFAVDAGTGALSLVQTVPSENPSFLALDSTQGFLYAVNEIDDFDGGGNGSLEAYAIDPTTGELTLINREDSGGSIPAHLAVDPTGSAIVVAHYVGSNYTVLPIRDDGGVDPVSDTVTNTGNGPNEARQEAPHPHATTFDPDGNFVATADLGIDLLQVFSLDTAAGTLEQVAEASVAPGAGPRHLAFLPDGSVLYVINELDATITAFAYDTATGQIGDEIQTISTVPDGFVGTKSTAEIVVYPNGQFLWGSNRGQDDATTPEADSIAGYTIDQATGELTLIGFTTDGIDYPRHFALDPTATWLYVCNQQADTIVQFLVDQATGALNSTGNVTETPTPVCIVFKSM